MSGKDTPPLNPEKVSTETFIVILTQVMADGLGELIPNPNPADPAGIIAELINNFAPGVVVSSRLAGGRMHYALSFNVEYEKRECDVAWYAGLCPGKQKGEWGAWGTHTASVDVEIHNETVFPDDELSIPSIKPDHPQIVSNIVSFLGSGKKFKYAVWADIGTAISDLEDGCTIVRE